MFAHHVVMPQFGLFRKNKTGLRRCAIRSISVQVEGWTFKKGGVDLTFVVMPMQVVFTLLEDKGGS